MRIIKLSLILATLLFSVAAISAKKEIVISSKHLGCNDTILITTPSNYSGETTPALFLFHGWSGNWRNWNDKADLQQMSDKYGFIIITPDGFYNSWYVNSVVPGGMQWRNFFNEELYPLIMKEYNLDSEKTFISGLSMGGHGAINVFLDDISRFRAAGSMSGVLSLEETRLKTSDIPKVLGPYTLESKKYSEESAINRLSVFKEQSEKSVYLKERVVIVSCGKSDALLKSSTDFAKKCDSLNIKNILILSPGNHTWNHWIYSLDLHLLHFSRIAKGEHLGY
jgi:S-formylglutathione hydrolase FrmB